MNKRKKPLYPKIDWKSANKRIEELKKEFRKENEQLKLSSFELNREFTI